MSSGKLSLRAIFTKTFRSCFFVITCNGSSESYIFCDKMKFIMYDIFMASFIIAHARPFSMQAVQGNYVHDQVMSVRFIRIITRKLIKTNVHKHLNVKW